MCTGPYRLIESDPPLRQVYERFDDYWRGTPHMKYVRFLYVLEWSTRSLLLKSGDADMITVGPPLEFEQLIGEPGIKGINVKHSGFTEIMYFAWDFDPARAAVDNNVPPDFFQDPDIRKGFAYAFPYEDYVEQVWLGYAEPAKSWMPPGFPGHFEHFPYTYDVEKATEHLKNAGDGKWWDEGFHVVAGCQTWAPQMHGIAYDLLAESLAAINPKFKMSWVTAQWLDMLDMPIGMLVSSHGVDPIGYRGAFHSRYSFGGRNYKYNNERVDELLEQSQALSDIDERLPLLQEAMDLVKEDCPCILTIYRPQQVLMRDYVGGFWYHLSYIVDLGNWKDITKG
jgi:peptide/nickel transport system substrate-binding protein